MATGKIESPQYLKSATHTFTNKTIAAGTQYVLLGSLSDFGLDSSKVYVVSTFIRGWSGYNGNGALSLGFGSDGTQLYAFGQANSSISSIVVRLWYVEKIV